MFLRTISAISTKFTVRIDLLSDALTCFLKTSSLSSCDPTRPAATKPLILFQGS